ncbi:MAG: amidohydrolase [Eubacterium sp.]|nr:amidohydrolase [Eubacterium sp.]
MIITAKHIVDSHAHIFPDKIASKASVNIGNFYSLHMCFDGSVSRLLAEGDKNRIDKFLVQSVATVPEQVSHINDFIAQQVNEHPDRFIGFASLHPDMADPAAEVDRVISLGLKGIKLHPDFQQFAIDDKRAYRLYEAVGDKLPFLIHTGDSRFKYSNPKLMAKVLDDCPYLRVIAAHFGGWSEWEESENMLCGKNVWVDTCSSLYHLSPEKAAELIEKFGEDRVFFGTDYPMWDAADELKYIERLPITEEQKEKILWKNICAFLDITMD